MSTEVRYEAESESATFFRRTPWGAVLAGVAVAMGVQVLLSVLGIAIGAAAIDPASEADPVSGVGTGTGIWLLLSSIAALLCGGLVAGKLAEAPQVLDRALHGLTVWGVTTLLSAYFLTSGIGRIVGGATALLGRQMASISQGLAGASPQLVEALRKGDVAALQQQSQAALERLGISLEAVQAGQIPQQALQRLEQVSHAISTAAVWGFFILLLGAIAAVAGGVLAVSRHRGVTVHQPSRAEPAAKGTPHPVPA